MVRVTASDRYVADWLIATRARLDAEEMERRQLEHEAVLAALAGRNYPDVREFHPRSKPKTLFATDPDQGYPVRHREPGEEG